MKLYYVPKSELDKIKDRAVMLDALRLNVLYQVQSAGSGHPGGSLSSLTIMVPLFFGGMEANDVFITSKGHDAPALYAILQAKGIIPFDSIHTFRRPGGLPGHPAVDVPGVMFNTGSLGMGISKANGLAAADRLAGRERKIHVLVGDGELQEGQVWEGVQGVYQEVTVHIDNNKHSLTQAIPMVRATAPVSKSGRVIIHETIKGSGISFMEGNNKYHAGALTDDEYARAIAEIENRLFIGSGGTVHLEHREKESYPRAFQPNEMIRDYSNILDMIGLNPKAVVMDADLEPDCGLTIFHDNYPERFIQCGIAEQDMVSMATGLAAGGFIPIVHSFAAFLCRRANEQIYNACLERRHIVFVGVMAGKLPLGPGTSHECLDDIALMKTMPGMEIYDPKTADELEGVMNWAVTENRGPVYVRIPCWGLEGVRV